MSDDSEWDHPTYETKGYIASEATRKQRIAICESCESLTIVKICRVCSCFMPAKVWVKFIDCPQRKWLREAE